MAVTFQPAAPQRFDVFWALEQKCHPRPWSESNLYGCLMKPYWGELMLQDDKPLGYYLFQQVLDEVTLVNICIDPDQQGNGFGAKLLTEALAQAREREAAVCFLEVRSSNAAAIGLYQKIGFSQDSVRKGYYPTDNGREDAVLMSLAL